VPLGLKGFGRVLPIRVGLPAGRRGLWVLGRAWLEGGSRGVGWRGGVGWVGAVSGWSWG